MTSLSGAQFDAIGLALAAFAALVVWRLERHGVRLVARAEQIVGVLLGDREPEHTPAYGVRQAGRCGAVRPLPSRPGLPASSGKREQHDPLGGRPSRPPS